MGGLAGEKLVPAAAFVVLLEGEAGHQHPVEETFQERGHRAPPGRKDEHQVLRPREQLERLADRRLEGLVARRAGDDVRIELQLAEVETPELHPRFPGSGGKRIRERPAQALLARMAENQQYFEARAHERQTRCVGRIILRDLSAGVTA